MNIIIEVTPTQEKFLKQVYGDKSLSALCQVWFAEWLEKRVDKDYAPTKTLTDKINEITK